MHFSKTYAQLLLTLPPELRENAIEYRQLKKLINQIVRELSSLGLSPAVLQELLERTKQEQSAGSSDQSEEADPEKSSPHIRHHNLPKVVYEVTDQSGRIEPHLRLWLDITPDCRSASSPRPSDDREESSETSTEVERETEPEGAEHLSGGHMSLLWALQRQAWRSVAEEREKREPTTAQITEVHDIPTSPAPITPLFDHERMNEVVIPLAADMLFFQTLSTAINGLSAHSATIRSDFVNALEALSRTIADSARPISSTSTSFRPHSVLTSKPWSVSNTTKTTSDLYTWREIFQLYVEAEVFQSVHELDRGERSLEESENRLKLFAERVTSRGLGDKRKLKSQTSRDALETFLELNVFILNIKKFQFANAEATRKILKKHTKRTSLPLPLLTGEDISAQAVIPRADAAGQLTRVLVQAIGETLLPIIPHLDDYACLICTSIAFKPIRLNCGHLFCVRCLVKMQKRGSGHCPMCRAPCVLTADRSNVDWALLNFMQDWFPIEAKEKLQQNEKEAAREELEELGVDPDQTCTVM
ncbi:putative SPX domain containing protein [Lyophyllum shimeji]|uniref:SPX domain containing protein n=1 Tax=Lyophyllum shimeji TaxID=47721 RepID=A0A9P3PTL0_LYOSH|nr:putative SPX domain containing protein [Lyophyllum shimeji]